MRPRLRTRTSSASWRSSSAQASRAGLHSSSRSESSRADLAGAARPCYFPSVRRLLVTLAFALAAAGPSLAASQTRLADLWLSGRDRPDPARVGNPLAYTVVIRNKGPNAAQGVALSGQVGRVGTATKRTIVLLKLKGKGKGCRNLPGTD